MPSAAVFQIPTQTKEALESMAHGNLSHALIKIIDKYHDDEITHDTEPHARLGIACQPETIAKLDAFVARNNLKSRNLAVTLLIQKAYQDAQKDEQDQMPD